MKNNRRKPSPIRLYSLVLFLFVLSIALGSGFQTLSEYLEADRYLPRGEMIKMDGYSMHIHCTGEGSPTVILESDLTYPSLQWYLVQRELAGQTRVCSYDRASLGRSEASPVPRKGLDMVEELFRLLRKAKVEGPLLLVGSGRGSWLTRLYAYRYPEEVAGLVLVAPAHEQYDQDLPSELNTIPNRTGISYRINPVFTWLGLTRLSVVMGGMKWFTEPFAGISVELRNELFAQTIYRTDYWSSATKELDAIDEIRSSVSQNRSLGSVSLVILANPPDLNDQNENSTDQSEAYLNHQSELTQLSTHGSLVICEFCGAMPSITAPQKVVTVILNAIGGITP